MGDGPEDIGDTVMRPRPPSRSSTPASQPLEPDLEDTVIRLVEPAPPVAGALELSTVRAPVPLVSPTSAGSPADAPLDAVQPVAWAMRVRGTTTIVPLDLPVVIGRRPGAPRPSEHPAPRRVVIPAHHLDVSSRHARIEQLGESLVVADLGSTNGVVVHWSTGANLRLRPGESCAVLPDAIIVLGDGVEIEFVAPTPSNTPQPSEPS